MLFRNTLTKNTRLGIVELEHNMETTTDCSFLLNALKLFENQVFIFIHCLLKMEMYFTKVLKRFDKTS